MSGLNLSPMRAAPGTCYSGNEIPDAMAKAIEEQQDRVLNLYGLLQALELAVEHRDRVTELPGAVAAATECANVLVQLLTCSALEARAKEIASEQAEEAEEERGAP